MSSLRTDPHHIMPKKFARALLCVSAFEAVKCTHILQAVPVSDNGTCAWYGSSMPHHKGIHPITHVLISPTHVNVSNCNFNQTKKCPQLGTMPQWL